MFAVAVAVTVTVCVSVCVNSSKMEVGQWDRRRKTRTGGDGKENVLNEKKVLTSSSKWVHQCRMCSCGRCIRLWFWFADFSVTLGEFQAYCLGHIGIEAYTLLQDLYFRLFRFVDWCAIGRLFVNSFDCEFIDWIIIWRSGFWWFRLTFRCSVVQLLPVVMHPWYNKPIIGFGGARSFECSAV